ncbi:MAG: archease [Nitrospirota bacterium]|jgi:SHS2 domain-containing protein
MAYETFEHEADVGVRGAGATLAEAFEEGARAMFSVMFEIERVEPRTEIRVQCRAQDVESLFVDWLNTLLAEADIQGLALSGFSVKIDGLALEGTGRGEPIDIEKHRPTVEVKGATYTMLKVGGESGRFVAQCVVDV